MLRKLILLSAAALTLQLCVTTLWPIGRAVLRDPAMLLRYQSAITITAGLLQPVALILFLVFLYREVTGNGGPDPRRISALLAAAGAVVHAAYYFANWLHTRAVMANLQREGMQIPGGPAAGPWHFVYLITLALWIAFLLAFWVSPGTSSRWTRRIAPALALAVGAVGSRLALAGFAHRAWFTASVYLAATVPLVLLLCLMSRQPGEL